jgi:Family of unknown function (DUF6221)
MTDDRAVTDDGFAGWLAARYDEAEARAKAAAADGTAEWHLSEHDPIDPSRIYDATGEVVVYDEGAPSPNEAAHIAACDPAHRLADIALKCAILAMYVDTRAALDRARDMPGEHAARDYLDAERELCALEPVVRQLGTEFAGQPGYREEWRPCQITTT